MQDGRNTSHSQEINVNSFTEELSSSDRTGRPVVSEDSKRLNVEQTHDRTERPVATPHTAEAQDDSRVFSIHDSDTLNVDDEVLRKRMENPLLFMTRIMNRWWWTRQTWTSEFLDYHFPLWNMRKVPAFENWFRKLRTTQIDMLVNNIYCKINHLILSVQNQKMIRDVGNIELCEFLETEPQTQCKVCLSYWNIGIFFCTCGHFLRKGREENQKFINSTMDLLSVPEYVIKKGRPHGHRYLVKSQETRNTIRLISWRKDARKSSSRASMIDSYEIQNSVIEWLKIIETKNFAENGMLLRMKIIPTIWPHKNTLSIRVTGGFTRTRKVPILCQWRTDLTSNRHCLPCHNWNKKAEGASQAPTYSHRNQKWAQSSSWWN